MSSSQATVAIISIGQMGLGIAALLQAHDFTVISNVSDRSLATQERAKSASITLVATDEELVAQADYVLSIVPPRDAAATASRIATALQREDIRKQKQHPLWFLELNAIAPTTSKSIAASFLAKAPNAIYLDGGIIGAPPRPNDDGSWFRPDVPLSGPRALPTAPAAGARLADVLNTQHLNAETGAASGLKCCFAALSKGFTALALQSFTTASALGVLAPLQAYLGVYNPGALEKAEKGVVGCTSKAGRWVEEMRQIGVCFGEDGGWGESARVFREIAGVFEGLAVAVERDGGAGVGSVDGVLGVLGGSLRGEDGLTVQELEQDDR